MTKKLELQFSSVTPLSISRKEYDPILDDILTPGANLDNLFEDNEHLHNELEELVRAVMSEFMINGFPNVTVLTNEKE